MAREAFIRSVWRAHRLLVAPRVSVDSPYLDPERVAKVIAKADVWLTPNLLEDFKPQDFADASPEQRAALQRAVEQFQEIARQVPPSGPAPKRQARLGRRYLLTVIEVLRQILLPEWLGALEKLCGEVEEWATRRDWAVKRDKKQLSEPLLGDYSAPRLLIHTLEARLLLDPITRFAAGAEGLAELCVLPSYDSAQILRHRNRWYIRLPDADSRSQMLSEATFVKTVRQLLKSL